MCMDDIKLINECVDYIIKEYIRAGGSEKDANRDRTYWALRGIYDREGKDALDEFIKNWKPHVTTKKSRGYM